jgi:hypothetical protein
VSKFDFLNAGGTSLYKRFGHSVRKVLEAYLPTYRSTEPAHKGIQKREHLMVRILVEMFPGHPVLVRNVV